MKRGSFILAFFIFFFLVLSSEVSALSSVTIEEIKIVSPNAASYSHIEDPVDHYLLRDEKGESVGRAFVTSEVPPKIKGYSGEIDLLVGIDQRGVITGLHVLSHVETPFYFSLIENSNFLKQFVGKDFEKGFDDIKAVTGATLSSDAIKRDIQAAVYEIQKKILKESPVEKRRYTISPFYVLEILAIVLLVAATFFVSSVPKCKWMRYVIWLASALVVGFWLNIPITIDNITDLRTGAFPYYIPLLIIFVFAVIASVMRGNLYCAYLCPFGALQECLGRLRIPKVRPSSKTQRNVSWLRWIILIVTIFGIASGLAAFNQIEPFSSFFSREVSILVLVQSGVILVVSLVIKRPWCRFFCPTGAILDIVNSFFRKVERSFFKRM